MASKTSSNQNATIKQEATIKPVEFGQLILVFTGQTSLLCNRINAELEEKLDGKGSKTSQKGAAPKKSIESLAYRNGKGEWAFPAAGIKKAIVSAARLTPMKMTELRASINVMTDWVVIDGAEPSIRTDTARKDGKALIRVQRAEFAAPWSMRVPISYVIGPITSADIVALGSMAGFGVGLGCWRPENNGPHGQFKVSAEVAM